jgi:hypothetical protein
METMATVVGHLSAIGFVVLRDFVAERRAGQVEGGGDVSGVVIGEKLSQHRDEDIDGVRRAPLLIRQAAAAEGMVRTVHL